MTTVKPTYIAIRHSLLHADNRITANPKQYSADSFYLFSGISAKKGKMTDALIEHVKGLDALGVPYNPPLIVAIPDFNPSDQVTFAAPGITEEQIAALRQNSEQLVSIEIVQALRALAEGLTKHPLNIFSAGPLAPEIITSAPPTVIPATPDTLKRMLRGRGGNTDKGSFKK